MQILSSSFGGVRMSHVCVDNMWKFLSQSEVKSLIQKVQYTPVLSSVFEAWPLNYIHKEKFHEKIISKQIQSGNIFLWQQLIKKLRIQSVYLITVFGCVLFGSFLF